MSTGRPSRRRVGAAALALGLASLPAAQAAPPSSAGGFHLPANYTSRFSSTELLASTEAGFGVRYFPLPFSTDVRLILAKQPRYWEYALTTRINDTTFAAGMFNNGSGAASGIPKFEITHDPFRGVQYGGLLQGNGAFSRFTGGYAFTVAADRVRVLNNVGVAYEGEVVAPYTQSEVGGGYGRSFGRLNTYFGSTVRAFTFPVQGQVQGSADLLLAASISPARGLSIEGSHFERFAVGRVPVGTLNFGRYRESNFSVTYRLPVSTTPPALALGAVRTRVTRRWVDDYTVAWGDVFLRVDALPSMVGVSVGHDWPRDPGGGRWLVSLAFMPK